MKNYVIIGGSSGIGRALCNSLSAEKQNVFATYNTTQVEDRYPYLKYEKYNVLEDAIDVLDIPDTIDGLVYCPGSINLKPFHRFKEKDFIDDFRLQVLGATKVIKHLLPNLKRAEHSSIVLFSTVAVQSGFNFHSQVAISKGAIEGLTKALSAELSPTIRVNAIAPSLTDTNLAGKLLSTEEKKELHSKNNPLRRLGEAEDVANTAHFLLSDKASYITGQIIHVDGGYSAIKK